MKRARVRLRTDLRGFGRRARRLEPEFAKPFSRISAISGVWHGSCSSSGTGIMRSGRPKMAKFEAVAFALGFVMTGLLTFVALPLA